MMLVAEVTETRNTESTRVNAEARQAVIDAGGEVRPLTDEQRAAWVAVMKPVWGQFADEVGQENIDAAQAINDSL
jgi:C4-dicarboxylate-binding protein DctP